MIKQHLSAALAEWLTQWPAGDLEVGGTLEEDIEGRFIRRLGPGRAETSPTPKGVLDTLSEGERRNFFAFLRSPSGQPAKP